QVRELPQQCTRLGPIAADTRRLEGLLRAQLALACAMLQQIRRDLPVAAQDRLLVDRASIPHGGRGDVRAVLAEQLDALESGPIRGPPELLDEHLRRAALPRAEPLDPRPAPVLAETVCDQQPQMIVAPPEHAVIERLTVVGIGARIQEQPRELL